MTVNFLFYIQSKQSSQIMIELKNYRDICAKYWNELLSVHGVPGFYDLDIREPERIAKNWIPNIQKYLGWYENEYHSLLTQINASCFKERYRGLLFQCIASS